MKLVGQMGSTSKSYFITSKVGKLSGITIYKYNFTEDLNIQPNQKERFKNWLKKNPNILLYDVKDDCFFTLLELENEYTWQYFLVKSKTIEPPYSNTIIISSYLSKLLKNIYSTKYNQFLNENVFCIKKVKLVPFCLLKCFQFNVEVFETGKFLIHFLPVSKIVSSSLVTHTYIKDLKNSNRNDSETEQMIFSLLDVNNPKRYKLDLLDNEFNEKAYAFLNKKEKVIATFNYHFVRNLSHHLFDRITDNTTKELKSSINFLKPIMSELENRILPDIAQLNPKPFYKISTFNLSKKNNLIVGNGKLVKEQKAAYHEGIYQTVSNNVIQPISVDGIELDCLNDLLSRFNKNDSLQILTPIYLSSNQDLDKSTLNKLKKTYGKKLLVALLTKHQLPKEFIKPIKKYRIKFQLYQGQIDRFKLSNFVVKCLEKLGGELCIIADTFEPSTSYFVGIDLGHTTQDNNKYSNLCSVLFDNKGRYLTHKVIKNIPRNEALNINSIAQTINPLIDFIQKSDLDYPKKLIVHRDGKVHDNDIDNFDIVIKKGLKIKHYDIVEIIKSGYPIISAYNFNQNKFENVESGISWILNKKHYSILVTNIQPKERGKVVSPIIIKHKCGETNFSNIVEQVFWFTKMYTNNLFNSTRLPATTEKANNLVSTSSKQFVSTYLA